MTKTFSLQGGSPNLFQTLIRSLFLIAATIGGFFIFAGAAAFALFVVIGLLILGFIVFGVLWLRAKILGKPLRPASNMWSFQTFPPGQTFDAGQAAQSDNDAGTTKPDGPVLDAHQTPDGWSVDSD